jgi:5-methylcytosine-specific restriction endonuclease McrA
MIATKDRTLLLTAWYFPYKVIRWEDAVCMIYVGKADSLVDYAERVSSPSTSMQMPAVIRLRRSSIKVKRGVKFSRINVFTRDKFRCQYCGAKKPMALLTFDHVIPRCCGGRTEWTNIVTACRPCNGRKADRTPDESGMFPSSEPTQPKSLPLTGPAIDIERAPQEWRDFLVAKA